MNAFAAGVRTMFSDPNMATAGLYTVPGQAGVPVRVMRTSVSDRVAGSLATFASVAEADQAEIQVAEVREKPLKGAAIAYDGRTRRVAKAAPAKRGATWLLTLEAS